MNKQAVIYGAGQMGQAAFELLKNKNCFVKCFVDKNKDLIGKTINNIPIIFPENITEDLKEKADFVISMTAAPFIEIKDFLRSLGCRNVHCAGDYVQKFYDSELTNIWNLDDINENDYRTMLKNLNILDDEESKNHYLYSLDWFWRRNENNQQIQNCTLDIANLISESQAEIKIDRNKYFPLMIKKLLKTEEIFIDTALLDGSYIELIKNITNNNFKKLYIFSLIYDEIKYFQKKYQFDSRIEIFEYEADEIAQLKNCRRLGLMKPYITEINTKINTISIDEKMQNIPYSFLRCYSMSPTLPILKGAIKSLVNNRPIIAVNISHYRDDFINVITYLNEKLTDYVYKFRIHSYQGCDCIAYAIPKERIL